jgi:CBS domain-containing protein
MRVRDGMSEVVLTVRPQHTLRDAAKAMASRGLGAAVVIESVGAGQSPDAERVADHLSSNLTFATPDWSLERAAEAMVRGGFRHLVVVDGSEMVGIVSMRDIVRCWVSEGATSEMPGAVASG